MFGEFSVWKICQLPALLRTDLHIWKWTLTSYVAFQTRAGFYVYSIHFGCTIKNQIEVAAPFWFVFSFGSFDYIALSLFSNTKLDNFTYLLAIICNPISLFSIYHRVLLYLGERDYKKCREIDSLIATNFSIQQFLMLRELNTKTKMKVACIDSSDHLQAVCCLLHGSELRSSYP